MRDLLITLMDEAFREIEHAKDSIPRQIQFPESNEMIKVAVGMRRAGKTYALYQRIQQLLNKGIPKERILFLDFEDDRLFPMTIEKMGALIDEFYSIYPDNHQKHCYVFLDEVQVVEHWHQVVRRIFKSKQIELCITGSSAKMLSSEINTSLRGRSLAVEVLPFSFAEYCVAHNIQQPNPPFSRENHDTALEHVKQFFSRGGFPAVQHMQSHDWRESLQTYVDTVILRDIIERHNISNTSLLKYLTKTLLINASSPFSVNKCYNDLKSQGYKVSRETLHTYIEHLEDAFLLFKVPVYSESLRAQKTNPYKIYAIDNGLINAYSVKIKDIYSKMLENQVYLDLRRQGKRIFYYNTQSGYEIDFVTIDKEGNRELIQVTWEMTDTATKEREERALLSAENELGIQGKILTAKEYAVAGV